MRAQHLRTPFPAASLHRVVADICGLHAQVMSSAELAAAVRLESLRAGTVATALWSDRSLVKAWAMRGTLHLLTTEDYPLYAAALSNRRFDLDAPWLKYHGLVASDVPALVDAVSAALDGRQLTRAELGGEVVRRLGDSKWETLLASGWGALLKPVAFQGRLCFGPSEGNRVTFVRPDQWLGPFERLDPCRVTGRGRPPPPQRLRPGPGGGVRPVVGRAAQRRPRTASTGSRDGSHRRSSSTETSRASGSTRRRRAACGWRSDPFVLSPRTLPIW